MCGGVMPGVVVLVWSQLSPLWTCTKHLGFRPFRVSSCLPWNQADFRHQLHWTPPVQTLGCFRAARSPRAFHQNIWLLAEAGSAMAHTWMVSKEMLPDMISGRHLLPAQSSKKDPSLLLALLLQSLGGSVAWVYRAVFPAAFQSWPLS